MKNIFLLLINQQYCDKFKKILKFGFFINSEILKIIFSQIFYKSQIFFRSLLFLTPIQFIHQIFLLSHGDLPK